MFKTRTAGALLTACLTIGLGGGYAVAAKGQLELHVVDDDTGLPVAARMTLIDPRGRNRKVPRTPYWHDHFPVDGSIVLTLYPGTYQFRVSRGPEYREHVGQFTIHSSANDNKTLRMQRVCKMSDAGWWSGDLQIRRPLRDAAVLMRAEDLHVGLVLNDATDGSEDREERGLTRIADAMFQDSRADWDGRRCGPLAVYRASSPLAANSLDPEYPSSGRWIREMGKLPEVHLSAGQASAWDLPMWIASGQLDSIALMDGGPHRSSDPDGKPADPLRYSGAHGRPRWMERVYHTLLNCGLRLPAVAGSRSGAAPHAVGEHRVYVHIDGPFSYDAWWQALEAGRTVVTNGPLLIPTVNGQLPGHVFSGGAGETITLKPALTLHTRFKVSYLELIKNGRVEHEVRLEDWMKQGGRLPELTFDESGWMMIRAVGDNTDEYRAAMSGPYYVQLGPDRRISREAATFFADWANERARQIAIDDEQRRHEVLRYHRATRDYWDDLLQRANAE